MAQFKRIVIGIDQSYTRTGISIVADNKVMKVSYVPFTASQGHSEKRFEVNHIVSQAIAKNKHKASQLIIVVERIRQFSKGVLSMDYIASTGALIGSIVDTAALHGIKVYSADTRSWKSQVVGTSKPKANAYNVDPNKWPTLEYVLRRGDVREADVLVPVSNRCKKFAKELDGVKYCYNDDAADSVCIALYGFCKKRNLKREV